ncbi:Golgi apparatus membrane protein tvp23 [Naganishia albida]|nr:Golgi apparatus membrane protein tvp23 [Naganishia albida]
MSASQPLFDATIEPDEDPNTSSSQFPSGNIGSTGGASSQSQPVVLTPGPSSERPTGIGGNSGNAESGISGILKSSSHPMVLACLYIFRSAALAVYVLCGLFTDNYVLSIVIVVVLLSLDFWNVRNVAGRTLVGLRYWNEVDEEGESSWVFECRDPSRPANPIDENNQSYFLVDRMFWIALYAFPLGWLALFFVSLLKFSISFLPIVILALVFNFSNVLGFTYADRDAKRQWANSVSSGAFGLPGLGGIGGQLVGGAIRSGLSRVFT